MLVRRFSLAENADGADNLINPISQSEANTFNARDVVLSLLGLQPRRGCGWCGEVRLSPCSRHRFACRQQGVIKDATAHAVNIADNQIIRDVLRRSAEGA